MFSNERDYVSRAFGTEAFIECRNKIESWMKG